MGEAKMTNKKAGIPTNAPLAAMRKGSAPRLNRREANPNPNKPPIANVAVKEVVSPTLKCKISPP